METLETKTAPLPETSRIDGGPVGLLLFEQGEDQIRIVTEGNERVQGESILSVPATGEPYSASVEVMRIMGRATYAVTIVPKTPGRAVLTVALNGRPHVTREFDRGANFVVQLPRLPQYVASVGDTIFQPLGYGRAGRWRLRSVPSGAEVRLLGQTLATDVDVARLEADKIRDVTFTKPGYRPCGFAEARISEENTDGKGWTVVTCQLQAVKGAP